MQPCGDCTLCCKLLEVHEIPSDIGVYCRHCVPSEGCSIHDERPNECREYQCMWTQMENVGEALRPDRCGIIFDRMGEDIITARLEEGLKLSPLVMGQIDSFRREGFSILIFRGSEKKLFLNNHHSPADVLGYVSGRAQLH